MIGQDVLDCPMDPSTNDAGAETVGGYLRSLLVTLWQQDESFSGKRPFGNSGWQHEVYAALAKAGLIEASYDSEWDEWDYQGGEGDALVYLAIAALGGVSADARG